MTGRQALHTFHLRQGSGSGANYQQPTHRFCGRGTNATIEAVPVDQLYERFLNPLEYMISSRHIPVAVQKAAIWSKKRVQCKDWDPMHVLMYGDFWRNNLLLRLGDREKRRLCNDRFVIIDWAGCLQKGYGIYDLYVWLNRFD